MPPNPHLPDPCLLGRFPCRAGTEDLKKENKSYSFSLGNDLKIKPIIEIEDRFQDAELGTLKRVDIKSMCDELLGQIRHEIYTV